MLHTWQFFFHAHLDFLISNFVIDTINNNNNQYYYYLVKFIIVIIIIIIIINSHNY